MGVPAGEGVKEWWHRRDKQCATAWFMSPYRTCPPVDAVDKGCAPTDHSQSCMTCFLAGLYPRCGGKTPPRNCRVAARASLRGDRGRDMRAPLHIMPVGCSSLSVCNEKGWMGPLSGVDEIQGVTKGGY